MRGFSLLGIACFVFLAGLFWYIFGSMIIFSPGSEYFDFSTRKERIIDESVRTAGKKTASLPPHEIRRLIDTYNREYREFEDKLAGTSFNFSATQFRVYRVDRGYYPYIYIDYPEFMRDTIRRTDRW